MPLNRNITYKGETLAIMEWTIKTGIPFKVLVDRLNSKWTVEKALTKKVRGWYIEHLGDVEAKLEYEVDDEKGHRKIFLDTEYGDQGGII